MAVPAPCGELVHADGRREPAAGLTQGKDGVWTHEKEGRRVGVSAGDVAVVVADDGAESVIIPELTDQPSSPPAQQALERLKDTRSDTWMQDAAVAASPRSRGVLESLTALAAHSDKELRRRAVHALVRMQTRESTVAATDAVLSEKDAPLRRELASALFAVQEIVVRCDALAKVVAGVADRDREVRITFALLAASRGGDEVLAVLRDEGLKSTDHHTRESAATALGLRGDGSGEAVLVSMLKRKRLPGFDRGDEETMLRYLVREQVQVCGILATLRTPKGRAALQAAAKSAQPQVREAATKALAGWKD